MAEVFKRLIRAFGSKAGNAAEGGAAEASAPPDEAPSQAPEGATDIRRVSRMTSALDLKNGLEVSEPVPLDELPDDLARELSEGSGAEMPTVRIRAGATPPKAT